MKSIAAAATEGDSVHLAPVRIQPMASDDVASGLCRVVLGEPVLGTVEIAGPEEFRLDELVRLGLAARDDPRQIVADPEARYFGARLTDRTLLPGSEASWATSLDPMSPVPPMTTIFMVDLHVVPGAVRPRTPWRPGDRPSCDTTAVSHPGVVGGPSVGGRAATPRRRGW